MANADRLKAFVALLGSDQPGEVAAAAAQLVKHLKAEGRDLHWLASLAAGEKPSSGERYQAPPDIFAQMQQMAKIAELQMRLNEKQRDIQRLSGENANLRHELELLRQAAAQNGGPKMTATQANAKKYGPYGADPFAKTQRAGFGAQQPWEENPFQQTYRHGTTHWRDMAEYAFIHGERMACLTWNENEFLCGLLDRSRDYQLSYKQANWLQDIYNRVRRVESSKSY